MTRAELLRAIIRQAKSNGFEYRKWYTTRIGMPWTSFDASIEELSRQRRYYAMLFAHEFAQTFWRSGSNMSFIVPHSTFVRVSKDGAARVVERRGHTRRMVKAEAWRYHLKAMAIADNPLRYIRKFLLIEEDLNGIQPVSDEADAGASDPTNGSYMDTNEDYGEEDFRAEP